MRSVPLIIGARELKLGTEIVGGFIVDVSIDGKAIRDDSVSLNLTSTYLLSANCFHVFGGFLTVES